MKTQRSCCDPELGGQGSWQRVVHTCEAQPSAECACQSASGTSPESRHGGVKQKVGERYPGKADGVVVDLSQTDMLAGNCEVGDRGEGIMHPRTETHLMDFGCAPKGDSEPSGTA